MPAMRLRIVHQLALLLTAITCLSTLAIAAVVGWNLRAGFSDYLRSRDALQLERFAQVVAERVDWHSRSAGAHLPMRELMDEFLQLEGMPPPRPRPPREEVPAGRPGPPPLDGPPPRDGPRGPPDSLPQRIQVVDLAGERVGGPPFAAGRAWIERPVHVQGQPVAYVRMLPSRQLETVDVRFLQRQYAGLAAALAATLLLTLAAALLAGRWLSRPLRSLQAATHRIAAGEFDLAIAPSGSREMADLMADVNRMAAALQQLEGARRRWIAQISHELRTPLSVLLGELEAIQDGVRRPEPALVASLRDEVLHLVRLVNDLHTLSMADLGSLPCVWTDGRPAEVLARVQRLMQPRLAQAGLVFTVEAQCEAEARWDFGRIEQLLTNLLENSLRYTDAPGEVRLRWRCDAHRLLLQVDDSPPGVDAAQLSQLFEPLFRADAARQRRPGVQGGSGLGLAICQAIVQAHQGSIRAEASPLGGLRIEAILPLQPENEG